jgi:hypothetical protein
MVMGAPLVLFAPDWDPRIEQRKKRAIPMMIQIP